MKIDVRRPELIDKQLELATTGDEIYGTWDGAIVIAITLSKADRAKLCGKPAEIVTIVDPFDTFWEHYPRGRRTGKGLARKSFEKLDEATQAKALAAVLNLKEQWEYEVANGKPITYCPMPATWLNQERWEDDPWVSPKAKGNAKGLGAYSYDG